MSAELQSHFVEVLGHRLHYTEVGSGDPVLLLHGWPTSSFLWRNVQPLVGQQNRVLALDLPGFGQSDKPLDASYSFRFFDRILEGFLLALGLEEISLAVHDLGGPVGLFWAVRNPEKVRRLALLNTLVYPEMSWAVVAFVSAVRLPLVRDLTTSPWGLAQAMRIGIANRERIDAELLEGVQSPFGSKPARRALAKAGCNLSPKGFKTLEQRLPSLRCPVRIVYGEKDRILPDVAKTMARVKQDLPQADVFPLPNCGHFLQEDRPDEVGRLLAEFFAPDPASPTMG